MACRISWRDRTQEHAPEVRLVMSMQLALYRGNRSAQGMQDVHATWNLMA